MAENNGDASLMASPTPSCPSSPAATSVSARASVTAGCLPSCVVPTVGDPGTPADVVPRPGYLTEIRLVLPASAVESQKRMAGSDAVLPQLQAFDPPLPEWLAASYGGCLRLRVKSTAKEGAQQGIQSATYTCAMPLLPLQLVVEISLTIADGDCTEVNALQVKAGQLMKRDAVRIEVTSCDGADGLARELATVYCHITAKTARRGLLSWLLWLILANVRWRMEASALWAARELLEEHWRRVVQRWSLEQSGAMASAGAGVPTDDGIPKRSVSAEFGGPPTNSTGPQTTSGGSVDRGPARSGSVERRDSSMSFDATGGADVAPSSGNTVEREALQATPPPKHLSVTNVGDVQMQNLFHTGLLYKLGDGLLNTTWNLRYFILSGATLRYFRNAHEAKPRDSINLSGAVVQLDKEQSRPFTFNVILSGHRPLCLSGMDEKEYNKWIECIRAATKLSPEGQEARNTAKSNPWQQLLALSSKGPETVEDPEVENAFQVCSQALEHAAAEDGYRLREVRHGLRILENMNLSSNGLSYVPVFASLALALLVLLLSAPALLRPIVLVSHLLPGNLFLHSRWLLCCPLLLVLALCWRLSLHSARGCSLEAPLVCAISRIDCGAEELRDTLADPSLFGVWRPGHEHGRLLSLSLGTDEVLYTRFQLGVGGMRAHVRARRRWIKGADGVRLLCCVADSSCSDDSNIGSCCGGKLNANSRRGDRSCAHGFEGFAVQPGEDNSCTVVWLCGLHLAPWAPRWAQTYFAVRRVGALAGLREWVACSASRQSSSLGLRAPAFAQRDAVSANTALQSTTLLRGFQCAAAGGLHAAADLERGAVLARLMLDMGIKFLCGGQTLESSAAPHGLTAQAGIDVAHRYASRWAYAPLFLPSAGSTERARDRLLQVIAFAVAGLHLAATSYPHLPWNAWAPGAVRHSLVLPGDVRVHVEVDGRDGVESGKSSLDVRRSTFEVLSRGFRISGRDEVTCRTELPQGLRFADQGVTTVELSPGGSIVRFTLPELRVRASSWCFGRGSIYEWLGSAHFVDVTGGYQCDLCFGPLPGLEASDGVVGSVRDSLGLEVGRIRGSWLGPLHCDNEVLWPGPRLQPAPY